MNSSHQEAPGSMPHGGRPPQASPDSERTPSALVARIQGIPRVGWVGFLPPWEGSQRSLYYSYKLIGTHVTHFRTCVLLFSAVDQKKRIAVIAGDGIGREVI